MAKATKEKDPRALLKERLGKMATVKVAHGAPAIPRADTGSKRMNKVLGGGYPRGHITEFFGKPGTGKTTMAVYAMRQALLRGERVFYFKGERRVDLSYWAKLGMPFELNPENGEWECVLVDEHGPMVDIISAETAEEAMQAWQWMLESKLYGVGVFDGITSVPPKTETETDMTKESRVGGVSKILTRAMRVMGSTIEASNCAVLIINQVRDNIGDQWNPMTTPGGWSLKHSQSLFIQMYDPKEDWVDLKTRADLKNIIFRYYIRKTSVMDFIGGLQEVVMSRDLETGDYEIDPVQEVFEVGKTVGLFTDKDGNPWNGKGNCYFDDGHSDFTRQENSKGHVLLGNGAANIIKTMRDNETLFAIMEETLDTKMTSAVQPTTDNDEGDE